jgi:hypothetical protein
VIFGGSGFVATGDNVLIGGFIAGPNTRVVVRAIGPSLAAFGINNPLLDPTLALMDARGNLVRGNDDWKQSQQAELEQIGSDLRTTANPRLSTRWLRGITPPSSAAKTATPAWLSSKSITCSKQRAVVYPAPAGPSFWFGGLEAAAP